MEKYRENYDSGDLIRIPVCDKSVTCELSEDVTLPDYQPDIKRLLGIRAMPQFPSRYVGNSSAEFSGELDYYVFYTGADNEIYCAPVSCEYRFEAPFEVGSALENMSAHATLELDTVSGRVISPRKINVKSRLSAAVSVLGDERLDGGHDFGGEGGLEMLYGETRSSRETFADGDVIHLSDEILFDRAEGEVRVISAMGKANIGETECVGGRVRFHGELYLKLLMNKEGGGGVYSTLRKLPFSSDIECVDAREGDSAAVRATVASLTVDVEEGRIAIFAELACECTVCKDVKVVYVKDVYSTAYETECRTRNVEHYCNSDAFCANFSLNETVPMEKAGLSEGMRVVDVTGRATADGKLSETGRITGNAVFNLLCEKNGEYFETEISVPYSYDRAAGDNFSGRVECSADVLCARVRMDGERAAIDAEISLCGCVKDTCSLSALESVSFGDGIARSGAECTVCYPTDTDSLWSVAKRYSVPVSSIRGENKLESGVAEDSRESLGECDFLII